MLSQIFHDQDAEILLNVLLHELQDVGLITWNGEGRITSLSSSCRSLMQLPGSVEVGGPVSLLWQSPCREFMQAFERFEDNKKESSLERELRLSRDGNVYWLDLKVRRCPISCGETSAFLMFVRDITDRRRVVELAQQSRDLFEEAFHSIHDAAIFVDPDRRVVKTSAGVERVFGYAEDELVGRSTRMLYVDEEDYRKLGELQNRKATKGGQPREIISYRRKGGDIFPAEASGGPLRDRNGILLGYIAIMRDFTQRLRLENDLREQTEMLESIFRQLPFALGVIDTRRQFVQMSDAALTLFGYSQAEMAGQSTRMAYASDEAFERAGELIYREQQGQPVIADLATRSGKKFKGRIQVSPLYDIDGRMKGYLLAVEDVTEQLQYEEYLRRYEEIVSASSDALVFVDANHVFQEANAAYLNLWQRQRHEVVGRHVSEIVGRKFYKQFVAPALARCFAGQVINSEVTHVDYPNGSLYVQARHNPYRNERGEITGVLINLRDVTQRHLAELAMKEAEQRFLQAAAFAEVAVWEMDAETRTPVDDAMLRRLLGYDSEDPLNNLEQWLSLVPEPDHDVMTASFERILSHPDGVERLECRVRKKSGDLVRHEILLEGVVKQGRRRLVGMNRDVTRLVEEREELRQYERMTSATADGLALVDRAHVYVAVNECYSRVHGLQREEIVGKGVRQLLGDVVYPGLVKPMLDAAFDGEDVRYESWFDYPQGGRRRMEVAYTPYRDEHGEITRLLVSSHDVTERYLAEQALMESENKFRAIFDNAPVGMVILDERDGSVLDVNPTGQEIYGYPRDEYLGLRPWDLVVGITPDNFTAHWQRMIKLRRTRLESVHRRKDGSLMHVLIDACRMQLKDQPVVIASLVEITQQKALEQRLREQEEQYRSLVESTSAILFVADPETFQFNFVSPEAETLLGFPLEQWLHEPAFWREHLHPEDRAWASEFCATSTKERRDHNFDYRMIAADGSVVWLHDITNVVVEAGRVARLVGVMVDISAQKAAEAALKQSEEKYRQIVETAQEGIWVIDADARTRFVNRSMAQMLGYSEEEMIGRQLYEFMDEESRKLAEVKLDERRRGLSSIHEFRFQRRDGRELWTTVSTNPLFDDAGRFSGAMAMINDNSEAHKLQKALIRSQRLEAVGQLTGGIAHDFNNILGSVLGFAELAQDRFGGLDAKLGEYLEQIETAGGRARDLIRQLLIFSRGENVRAAVAIPLSPLIKEFVKMLTPMLPANVEIHTDLPRESPSVKVDPLHIQQLLMNLCINARDAIDGPGLITIAVSMRSLQNERCDICGERVAGEWVCLQVADTGRGIPPQLGADIFQPFVTSKEVGEGSGMGLAVVGGIVRSYGGHLLVDSTPDRGTRFEVILPAALTGTDNATEVSRAGGMRLDLAGRKILVVDDEIQIRGYFKALLGDNGAEVVCCGTGIQALGRFVLEPESFDLVICDQSMPGMNGSEMVRQLRELGSQVPVIIYSGYGEILTDEMVQSLSIGMVLHKPADRPEILSAIRRLLQDAGRR